MPAHVSLMPTPFRYRSILAHVTQIVAFTERFRLCERFCLCVFDYHFPHANIQLPRRTPSVQFAPHVSPSVNPAKRVVVVAGALGSEPAEVLTTHKLSTRGTRAFGPAKHGDSPM